MGIELIPTNLLYIVLSVLGFSALAWEGAKTSGKNASMILAGGALLLFIVVAQMFGPSSYLAAARDLFFAFGIGLVTGAAILLFKKAPARVFGVLGLSALSLSVIAAMAGSWFGASPDTRESVSILLELGPDDTLAEVQPILDKYGAKAELAFPEVTMDEDEDLAQYYLVDAHAGNVDELIRQLGMDRENVDYVTVNEPIVLTPVESTDVPAVSGSYAANDPRLTEQWGFHAIHGDGAHRLLRDVQPAKKARIAVVDTGVDSKHEDISGVFRPSRGNVDGNGHGTHCAGLAGGIANNGIGIASLNWQGRFVEVEGYDALSATGAGTMESVAQAIIDAADAGVDVISLSLGAYHPEPPKVEVDAIEYALRKGIIVVAAAGNSNEHAGTHAPANIPGVIAVSAVDQNLRKASFSNTNDGLSKPIAAPGVGILSTKPRNHYEAHNGTSMATPIVSGLIGILRSIQPDITADEAYELINRTGTSVRDSRKVGRVINAEAAIRVLLPKS